MEKINPRSWNLGTEQTTENTTFCLHSHPQSVFQSVQSIRTNAAFLQLVIHFFSADVQYFRTNPCLITLEIYSLSCLHSFRNQANSKTALPGSQPRDLPRVTAQFPLDTLKILWCLEAWSLHGNKSLTSALCSHPVKMSVFYLPLSWVALCLRVWFFFFVKNNSDVINYIRICFSIRTTTTKVWIKTNCSSKGHMHFFRCSDRQRLWTPFILGEKGKDIWGCQFALHAHSSIWSSTTVSHKKQERWSTAIQPQFSFVQSSFQNSSENIPKIQVTYTTRLEVYHSLNKTTKPEILLPDWKKQKGHFKKMQFPSSQIQFPSSTLLN